MKSVYQTTSLAFMLATSVTGVVANTAESFLDTTFYKLESAVPGKFNLDARLRYESFDLQNAVPANDRDGHSLRLRYGYTTPNLSGFTAMIEGETVTRVGGQVNDIHPLDEAGDGTDLNQLWLQYQDAEYGHIKLGRQIYALDDHRFIGHVGWRQNIQTFDAVTAEYSGIEKLSVKPFYLAEQHSVNGLHNELKAYGLNVAYRFSKAFVATAFYYDIDGDEASNADASNETLGLRVTGTVMLDELPITYAASLAEQTDAGASSKDYDAAYYAADVSTQIEAVTLGGGFEIMQAEFRTPLATVHKFNGFADALLPTGGFANGLEDLYLYAGYTLPIGNGIPVKVIYHWFDSESSGAAGQDGGKEIDLVASYRINQYVSLLAKYGDYESDGGVGNAGAVDKEMFTFELNFKY
ncbi:alginate export family protein [Coraliomargarita algicola]|uniref:Alginate export family protein n=1 Tax=Coraliomargarita algicola TaxID=3092156 RepID=A0ABZ0RKQ1_9BACT|nr:alginate export family protein [Coraliomargarita sp. J2-16]WPJ96794.1 alginate export family protein [Coraliomargarita sp. J2-16]